MRSSGLWSSGLARFLLAQEKLLRIPKRVVVQIGGSKVAQARLCSHQDVPADQANEREIFRHQPFEPVVHAVSLFVFQRSKLLVHQAVKIVKSTAWPRASTSAPSLFQEKPPALSNSRAFSRERGG